jgi:hypothetical protein
MTDPERVDALRRAVWETVAKQYGEREVLGEVARSILAGTMTTQQAASNRFLGEVLLDGLDDKLRQMREHAGSEDAAALTRWLRGDPAPGDPAAGDGRGR